MPRRQKAMKDVVNCEKLRVVETGVDPEMSEWGNPAGVISRHSSVEYIDRGGERGELKHLSTPRNRNQIRDSPSSGERTGNRPNRWTNLQRGCRAGDMGDETLAEQSGKSGHRG